MTAIEIDEALAEMATDREAYAEMAILDIIEDYERGEIK